MSIASDPQRRGLIADLGRRLVLRNLDELRVLDAILLRLELGADRYGELDLRKPRDWARERTEELLDAMVYEVAGELAERDLATAELQEQARAEVFGFAPVPTVVSATSARLALEGDDEPYASWDVSDVGGERG